MLQPSAQLFAGRYSLVRLIDSKEEYQLWEGRDVFGGPMLLKVWPFGAARPADEERALWNLELRHLFRLASVAEGEEHLVTLRDAGIDWQNKCFVMALSAPGLWLLQSVIAERAKYDWLRDLKSHAVRAELWRGIRRLVLGLIQIHQQQMFHRAITAGSVFVDPERGPSTLRLGGFEWAVRLGEELPGRAPSILGPTGTYSFEADWFLLGKLIARLLLGAEEDWDSTRVTNALQAHEHLIGDERDLIDGLLADSRTARLSQSYDIVRRVDQIVTTLDEPRRLSPDDYLALVVLLGPQRQLTVAVCDLDETISPLDLESQRRFIETDLEEPRIVRRQGSGRETYTLLGNRVQYFVQEHVRNNVQPPGTWDLAYCGGTTELRSSAGEDDQVELTTIPIRVFTLRALAMDENVVRRGSISWRPFLPSRPASLGEQDRLQRLHDFFRVTNQIELLMHDAEIFGYSISQKRLVDGAEEVLIQEAPRLRPVAEFARLVESLPEFLNREAENRDGDLVYLGDEDALDLGREVPRASFWNVMDANPDSGIVRLRRPVREGQAAPPNRGYLRAFGLFGQMSLIRRRKRAIDRLGGHAYLLRSLQNPAFTFVDTGAHSIPREVPPEKLDDAKRAALHSIWRTRPIFALQGPPGTGKTTLVANLLAQIFVDDAVAQVLVTAQAHAAVDVLREKVAVEVKDLETPPLAVRLYRTKGDVTPDPDYVDQVAHRLLANAVADLGKLETRSPLQSRWLEAAQDVMGALARGDTKGHARDFCELVKRAAGITYCTTTAGNLAELADSTQTFDWSIVEEAGKAHGFDLVLPLQTGHRWLLIGDQKQLSPYRYEDFRNALQHLDDTFAAIEDLPRRGGGQVDVDLLLRWAKYEPDERAPRRELWLQWLRFFETLHDHCSRAKLPSETGELGGAGAPVLAQMLSQQHRMHPVIAGLVSAAYYDGQIESMTSSEDGRPLPRVTHSFVEPAGVGGRAILWVDVPWVGLSGTDARGEDVSSRYTNEDELDAVVSLLDTLRPATDEKLSVAVLSPYRRQVRRLSDRLKGLSAPTWIKRQDPKDVRESKGLAATVDSFQGNQADVVIVSLVRNNEKEPGAGLGFLREARRMNVLFSRAERLLVLVGSWEFFQNQLTNVPLDPTQPLGHWSVALNYLDEAIKTGKAVRLPAHSLGALK